jgi:hypothetical protein
MAATSVRTPNLYQLQGENLHVSYSSRGIAGRPHLAYQDLRQALSFDGDAIRSVETEIGTLATVTIFRTVDSGSTSFTLLVPRVNLGPATSVPITTQCITTLHRFSLVPALNHGQTETYNVVQLTGTASEVEF